MLEALYKYAQDHQLAAVPGFKPKKIKYYISFSSKGDFIGFETVEDGTEEPLCPDIGSLANGTAKSNIIAEKAEVIFDLPDKNGVCKRKQKQCFYLDALTEAAEHDELFLPAAKGFKKHIDEIKELYLSDKKKKPADFISIKVDGKPLESSKGYIEWWNDFRKQFDTKKKSGQMRCMITGELTDPVKTVPPVQGLLGAGGHTKGDSFICFDKDAFRSYGLEKAANAAVSEEAVTAVNSALARLMKDAPVLAGAKNIHWFSSQVKEDVFDVLDFSYCEFDDKIHDNDKTEEDAEQIESDEQLVRNMFDALMKNALPDMPKNRYYMMSLTGVNGRVMIRSYDEGTYDELCGNLRAWYSDLAIYELHYGKRYPKLYGVYGRLLKKTDSSKKLGERIKTELSGLAPQILYAVMHNMPLPDSAAAKALAYIRSDMYDTGDNETAKKIDMKMPDMIACQFLKAWLNRKYRQQKKEEYILNEKLDPKKRTPAFLAGELMAVYASLQYAALKEVGAGVIERYYTSACTAPKLVMGKLSTMAQYHLSKLRGDRPGLAQIYSKDIEQISCEIGNDLPVRLSLPQQTEFSLGYYSRCSKIRERIEAAKNNKTEE